jgi:surface antigen
MGKKKSWKAIQHIRISDQIHPVQIVWRGAPAMVEDHRWRLATTEQHAYEASRAGIDVVCGSKKGSEE